MTGTYILKFAYLPSQYERNRKQQSKALAPPVVERREPSWLDPEKDVELSKVEVRSRLSSKARRALALKQARAELPRKPLR